MTLPFASVVSLPPLVWPEHSDEARVEKVRPPPVRTSPLIVEEAEVALSAVVWIPPAKVEVAVVVETMRPNCPRPASMAEAWMVVLEAIPPANVEVAVDVEVIEPVVRRPVVILEKVAAIERKMFAKSEVVVALVERRFTKVEVAVEVAVMVPAVRLPIEEEER